MFEYIRILLASLDIGICGMTRRCMGRGNESMTMALLFLMSAGLLVRTTGSKHRCS